MDERPKGLVDGVDEAEREKQKKQTTTMVKAGKWVLCVCLLMYGRTSSCTVCC